MMNRATVHLWLGRFLRAALGGVLIYAGYLKVLGPQDFADSIAAYELLPLPLISLVALGLPVFEILLGALLISGWKLRVTAFSAVVLTVVFALAISSAIARGLNIDCGCFASDPSAKTSPWIALGRDLLMLIAAVYLWVTERKRG